MLVISLSVVFGRKCPPKIILYAVTYRGEV